MSNLFKSFSEAILRRLDEGYKEAKARFIKDGASEDEVSKLLDLHKKLKDMRRLSSQDLNIDTLAKDKTFEELKDYLSKYSETDLKSKKDRWADLKNKIVGENSKYIVYQIDSVEEAWLFHGKVHWCISSGDSIKKAKRFWDLYTKGGRGNQPSRFYMAIGKNVEHPYNYLAIQVFEEGEKPQFTVWNTEDNKIDFNFFDTLCSHFGLPKFKFEYKKVEFPFTKFFEKTPEGTINCIKSVDRKILKNFIKNGKFTVKFNIAEENFDCSECGLISLEGTPIKVKGFFNCSRNSLKLLKGCPIEVRSIDCSFNQLTSLENAPQKIENLFNCSHNNLTSLKGAPKNIRVLDCSRNKLTSLEGCPQIKNTLRCSSNLLTTLEGCPKGVENISCGNNKLTSLKGCPQKIIGDFSCSVNELISLKGGPKEVGGSFDCYRNKLTTLEGSPEKVGNAFYCYDNYLTSLDGAPKEVGGSFDCAENKNKFSKEDVTKVSNVKGLIHL